MAFTKSTADLANISKLDDEPNDVGGLSAAELKAEFDAAAETLQSFVNTHVTELESSSATGNIGTIGLDGTTATNVQAVIVAIKALIDACETQAAATASFALKEDKTVTAQHYKAVTFDTNTGIFTFTRENGSTTSIDTALEKVATNWVYDAATQSLILTLADGSTQSISLSAFITESEYLDSDTLDFSVSDHKITATVKDGSITDTKLSSALKTTLQNYVTQAATSATNAAASEANALTYKNTAQSAQSAAVNAQTAAETAQEDAEVSAANAATSETNAGTSATNADGSAKDSEAYAVGKRGGVDVTSGDPAYQNNSKYYKEQAAAIVGGDYATKTVPSAAGNVATLDASGNLADGGHKLSEYQNVHKTATVSLASTGWSNKTIDVNVTGVTAANTVIIAPVDASQTAYLEAEVSCTAQGAGTLTFVCETVPTANISVNVVMLD